MRGRRIGEVCTEMSKIEVCFTHTHTYEHSIMKLTKYYLERE
jgi:hypothetical protein